MFKTHLSVPDVAIFKTVTSVLGNRQLIYTLIIYILINIIPKLRAGAKITT